MNKNSMKNPKGAGRKQKYSTEQLLNILDSFLIHEYYDEINYSILARYAEEKLAFYGIRYYHFSNNVEVTNKINDLKKSRKHKYVSRELFEFQNVDIDTFLDLIGQKKNIIFLKEKLCQLQLGQLEMYNKMVQIETENRKLENELKFLKNQNNDLNHELNKYKSLSSSLVKKINLLKCAINVENHFEVIKYIWNNTYLESSDVTEQYLMI